MFDAASGDFLTAFVFVVFILFGYNGEKRGVDILYYIDRSRRAARDVHCFFGMDEENCICM